jgi:hypothetical protein
VHLSVHTPHRPALHLPAVHLPALRNPAPSLTGRLPVATVLLTVVYALAIGVALTAPGQHALAGCAVLVGLVSRSVVRRRRSAVGAVAATTAAVDAVLPTEVPATAPAPAA